MFKAVRHELAFKGWQIYYDPESKLPYSTHAHWYAEAWNYDSKDPLTSEHRHERFATYKEAIAWCKQQEKL